MQLIIAITACHNIGIATGENRVIVVLPRFACPVHSRHNIFPAIATDDIVIAARTDHIMQYAITCVENVIIT